MSEKQVKSISKYHKLLSLAIGRPIGVKEFRELKTLSPTDHVANLVDSLNNNIFELYASDCKYEKNCNPQFLEKWLWSKDDSLILNICLLFYTFCNSQGVDPALYKLWKLNPIGRELLNLPKDNNSEEETKSSLTEEYLLNLNEDQQPKEVQGKPSSQNKKEEQSNLNLPVQLSYNSEVVERLINLLSLDPSFRMITFKLISNIIYDLWYHADLNIWLSEENYGKLFGAYYNSVQNIRFWLK